MLANLLPEAVKGDKLLVLVERPARWCVRGSQIMAILAFLLGIIVIANSSGSTIGPTVVVRVVAVIIWVLSYTTLACILFDLVVYAIRSVQVPKNSNRIFRDILRTVDLYRGVFETYAKGVQKGRYRILNGIVLPQELEENVAELQREAKGVAREYLASKRCELIRVFLLNGFLVILVFASLIMAQWATQLVGDKVAGEGVLASCVSGLFWSITTFATLGAGESFPESGPFNRFTTITEVACFLLLFGFGMSFATSLVEGSLVLSREELGKALRKYLIEQAPA